MEDVSGQVAIPRVQGAALRLSPEVRKQIGIDITEYPGLRYKQWDDLLNGIFCAYLAYYFWYWGEEGCCVVGDLETGYVTLPKCPLGNCPIARDNSKA